MVVYNLACEQEHRFEGWFGSAEVFDARRADGTVSCPVCGSQEISRRPAATYIKSRGDDGEAQGGMQAPVAMTANDPSALWAKMVEFVRRHTEDVGRDFPDQARKIHYHDIPVKNIRGTASHDEIAELRDEGIEVFPLPPDANTPDKLQ
jgi:hypothetical protein